MTSQVSKVRFVRCPKCRQVLAEIADIPVYQCGGCHTVLRAKNANFDKKSDSSIKVENISSQNNPLQHESEKVEQNTINKSHSSSKKIPFSCSNGSAMTDKIAVQNEDPPLEKVQDHNHNKKGDTSENVENSDQEVLSDFSRASSAVALDAGERNSDFLAQDQSVKNAQGKSRHPLEEQVDGSLEIEQLAFERVRSRDETEESADRSIDGSIALVEDTIRSVPSAKNSHDRGGNVSSHDDRCKDRIPNWYRLFSKRTFRSRLASESNSKEVQDGEDALVNGKISMVDSHAQVQERILSSKSSSERYGSATMGSFRSNLEEPTSKDGIHASQQSMDVLYVQNWMKLEPKKDILSKPLSRDSHLPTDFHGCHPTSKFWYLEQDRKELLQKVDELRDQIKKTNGQRGKGNTRVKNRSTTKGNRDSLFRNNESEHDTQFPSRAPRPVKTEPPQPHQFSQLHVSGQANFSCLHCQNREDWQVSIKFPPNTCYNKAFSCQCQPSQAPEQLHKAKLQGPKKRHYRPVARGAPFVICHNCLQLLHLPQDFLISSKKYHKLRCDACSDVLMFSLSRDGAHITAYSYDEMQHPPSEVGSSKTADVLGHEIPISHAKMYLQGDPVSYSEEYELSVSKSHSSDGEPVLHASRDSSETQDERSNGNQRKLASPLHRLMGYSSARLIINQPSNEGEVFLNGTRFFYEENSSGGVTSPYLAELDETGESLRRSKDTGCSPTLGGFMKKGIVDLNHGLKSMKVHANGRAVPAPW